MKRVFLSAMVLVLFAIALSTVAVTLAPPKTALAAQLYSIDDDPNDPEPQPESVSYIDDDPNDPEPQPENALCIALTGTLTSLSLNPRARFTSTPIPTNPNRNRNLHNPKQDCALDSTIACLPVVDSDLIGPLPGDFRPDCFCRRQNISYALSGTLNLA